MAFHTTQENTTGANGSQPVPDVRKTAQVKETAQDRCLFRRFQSGSTATANPFPRPRDEHGDTRARKYTYDGTIPNKGALLSQHGRSLELIARQRPLRAAMLRDTIDRVDAATDRHGAVVAEEESALQLYNEDAANAQAVVRDQLDALNDARSARETLEDAKCAECRRELADSRSDYAADRARAGLPVSLIELRGATLDDEAEMWGGTDGSETPADGAPAKADNVEGNGVMGAAREPTHRGGSVLARLFRRDVPEKATAQSGPAASDKGGPQAPDAQAGRAGSIGTFPIESARRQAKPAGVHAHEGGFPASSTAARIAHIHWVPDLLALLTCGAIFGSSIGLLLGFIDPDAMQVAAARQIGVWAVCSVFGVALFYVLGCTAEAIFALISEQYHGALVATHRNEPASVGRWLRRAAGWTAVVGTTVFALLIGIEAVVERYGIVQLAISRMSDAIMLGHAAAPKADLQGVAASMIALIASVPFMCFHAVKGWTRARLGVLEESMEAGHVQEAWDIASKHYREWTVNPFATEEQMLAVPGAVGSQSEPPPLLPGLRYAPGPAGTGPEINPRVADLPQTALDYMPDREKQVMHVDGGGAATLVAAEEPVTAQARDHSHPARQTHSGTDTTSAEAPKLADPAQMETLARSNERLREAFICLREAYRGRRDALQPFDTQIGQLQAMIVQERMELPLEAKRRIEDAYADVIGAVQTFDRMYQEELQIVERLMRGGVFVRLRDWLFRPAG